MSVCPVTETTGIKLIISATYVYCSLFNDATSSYDYTVSNYRTAENWTGKDVQKRGRALI